MLRIDLDNGSGPAVSRRVSCDAYEGRIPDSTDPDNPLNPPGSGVRYLGWYRTRQLDQSANPESLSLSLFALVPGRMGAGPSADGLADAATTLDFISIDLKPPNFPGDRKLPLVLSGLTVSGGVGPSGPMTMKAVWIASTLRTLHLKVDRAPGIPDPFDIVAPIPGAGAPRGGTVNALGSAGFKVDQIPGIDGLANRPSWTLDQLKSAVATTPSGPNEPGDSLLRAGVYLSSYLLVVSSLDRSSDTSGLMWDRDQRLSAAIFYNTLTSRYSDEELKANYLLTVIHELGHSLNLPHAFDQSHLREVTERSPTFMNYPQNYAGDGDRTSAPLFKGRQFSDPDRTRYARFWTDFTFQFDPYELIELRHGARANVSTRRQGPGLRVPGRLPQSGGNGDGADESRGRRGEGAGAVLDRSGRAGDRGVGRSPGKPGYRPGTIFEFGEPIHVEARLRSTLKAPRR